jgi:nitrate reductase alpha subunit
MFKGMRYSWLDVVAQPRRTFPSPCWTGMTIEGRAYAPYCTNVELLIPWRTLTCRQHIYLDHPVYIEFDEQLPTSKPMPEPQTWGDLRKSRPEGKCYVANIIMPHGKWNIHSTYKDNHRMLTLSRGMEPVWINDKDAADIGVRDNDWIEVYNDHGVVVARCVVSARVPRGMAIFYHAPERTIDIPRSPIRGMRRGGNHNALTRIRLKPCYLTGGYAQFSYFFNTWGPVVPVRDNYVYIRKYPGEVRY